jgi:hypothetical protein
MWPKGKATDAAKSLRPCRRVPKQTLLQIIQIRERLRLSLIHNRLKSAHQPQNLLVVIVDLGKRIALLAIAFDGAYAPIRRIIPRVLRTFPSPLDASNFQHAT